MALHTEIRDPCTDPLWRAEDLGKPIPDSPHAVSVALPTWDHAVGYEENDPAVVDRLALGYPRFVHHPLVTEVCRRCETRFAGPQEFCVALPSLRHARECAAYLTRKSGVTARLNQWDGNGVYVVTASREAAPAAKAFWQHTGWVISSRRAEAMLDGTPRDEAAGRAARKTLRDRLAALYGASPENVFLFPSGMAALTTANGLLQALHPGRLSVQLGFPYVDVLKVQEEIGPGARFVVDPTPPAGLPRILDGERVSGFVTELPSNPLLRSADLPSLSELARAQDGLVVVDDTAGTPVNVEITPYADLIAVSLTKYMSGRGDVLGGALLVSPRSPHGERLRDRLAREHEELLWWSDAVVLEERSRDFVDRMRRINKNAEALAERLRAHPRIEQIYYPKFDPGGGYDKVRRRDGGYGGLLSILVRDAPTRAPVVYDNLRVSKGPNLGTAYTLACPYTILAHYGELDWAESCGVSRWLIRVSVGLENIEDLWSRFEDALAANA